MTSTTYRISSETGLPRPDNDRKELNEKGENEDNNAYTKGYPENSFDVYGDEDDADIKYRTMGWWKTVVLMIAHTVSLGVFSLPSAFASLGMVAGIFLIIGLGAIATITGYAIGSFKLRYPHVHNMADAGEILAGPIGREVLGSAQVIFMVFLCASHVLTGTIAFDTITDGASCSVVWAVVSVVICFVMTLPRTLNGIANFSVASFISILGAIMITMIGVGIIGHQGTVSVTSNLTFAKGFLAVTDIVTLRLLTDLPVCRPHRFLHIHLRDETASRFPKALYALQICDITIYLIVAIVVYAYTGDNAISPALGNTAYGIALPTIMIAGVINGHVCAKLIYIRVSHPFFNDLLGVISSLFAAWFTYGISGVFWLHLNPRKERWTTGWMKVKTVFWWGVVMMGGFIMVAGLYASIVSIIDGYQDGSFPAPFSCVNRAMT
ncbi:transmembrane amino acid transporter protein-domain-containing protein [Irpex lacteus]|nr:transmembrane amino acid transporter protein-domain-containing protein [Irpex lacteus]